MDSRTGSNHSESSSAGKVLSRATAGDHSPRSPARRLTHLALQPVGFLGPLSFHVFRQHRIVVQFLSVVEVTGESLGLLSMPEVHHVHGQAKVGFTLLKPFLIFNLECNKTGPIG